MDGHLDNRDLSLESHWMPFTANRQFKADPRLVERAQGVHYFTPEGRAILDMTSGLWCCNLGHGRVEIADAIAAQARSLDYAPSFSFGHPIAYELSNRLVAHTPEGLDRVFYTGSGSEAVETALKIAMAYHAARGEGGRKRIIGRQKAYHGVNFGGVSVGGITANRSAFGQWLPVDHLRHTLDLPRNAFSRGLPDQGAVLADELEELIVFHGPATVAAVIVEPIAGAGGVILPPQGYLQRLREICDRHGVLLIFDEVITGFGRTGSAFAAIEFGVTPDIMTTAKGISSGTAPIGAVFSRTAIYETITASAHDGAVEFFHGYTHSAHPLCCAAALACLEIYEREGLFARAGGEIGRYFEEALHSLTDLPRVRDIRNYGLIGAVEFEPDAAAPGSFGATLLRECWTRGVMIRGLGDTIAVSPPLIVEPEHLDQFVAALRDAVAASVA